MIYDLLGVVGTGTERFARRICGGAATFKGGGRESMTDVSEESGTGGSGSSKSSSGA